MSIKCFQEPTKYAGYTHFTYNIEFAVALGYNAHSRQDISH